MEITHENLSNLATNIVSHIGKDMLSRSGLRQAWDSIDVDIQSEIIGKWENDTYRILRNTFSTELSNQNK